MEIVEGLCLGHQECVIPATTKEFKGDPCYLTKKQLAVSATCTPPTQASSVFAYQVTVPVGSQATVVLPTWGQNPTGADSLVQVTEGGKLVWAHGAFAKDSAPEGVVSAQAATDAAGGPTVEVSVGSGSYNFDVISKS